MRGSCLDFETLRVFSTATRIRNSLAECKACPGGAASGGSGAPSPALSARLSPRHQNPRPNGNGKGSSGLEARPVPLVEGLQTPLSKPTPPLSISESGSSSRTLAPTPQDAPVALVPLVSNELGIFLVPQALCGRREATQTPETQFWLLSCCRGPGPGTSVARGHQPAAQPGDRRDNSPANAIPGQAPQPLSPPASGQEGGGAVRGRRRDLVPQGRKMVG